MAEIALPPLVGIGSVDHPVWLELKKHMPKQIIPVNILQDSSEYSVLSLAFPRKHKIVKDSISATDLPARSWFESKNILKQYMPQFSHDLCTLFEDAGITAWSAPGDFQGNWSERHVGYACGLGTFGLNGALITEAGATHRLMSFIIKARFDVYSKVAKSPFANCLYHAKETCGACIRVCPKGAIDNKSHHPDICGFNNSQKIKEKYGLSSVGCALCMIKTPCAMKNPMQSK